MRQTRGQRRRAAVGEPLTEPRAVTGVLTVEAPEEEGLLRGYRLELAGGGRDRPVSAATVRLYLTAIGAFQRFCAGEGVSLTTVARAHALAWVAELRRERAAATARVYVTGVALFYRWLVEAEEIEAAANPFTRIAAPAIPVRLVAPYSHEEVRRILASEDTRRWQGLRNVAIYSVLADTGLRLAECAGLKTSDIDWKHGVITVIGKGDKQRRVRMGAQAQRAVDRYLRARERRGGEASEWLWLGQRGRLTATGIAALHVTLGERLGIHAHAHRWRHYAAQSMLDSGMSWEAVRDLGGWESDEIMRRYTRASSAARALEAHIRHSPLDTLKRGSTTTS